MPPLEEVACTDVAVLWVATGKDRHNDATFATPVEIPVRWEQSTIMGSSRFGEPISFAASVVVLEEIPEGSLLWQGTLADWYGTGSGGQDTGLVEVSRLDRVPDIKGRCIERIARCTRFRTKPGPVGG